MKLSKAVFLETRSTRSSPPSRWFCQAQRCRKSKTRQTSSLRKRPAKTIVSHIAFTISLLSSPRCIAFACSIGIISLTKVSSRDAGIACGAWMFLYGMLGKVGAFFTSIPQPVLGGMSSTYYITCALWDRNITVGQKHHQLTSLSLSAFDSLFVCQHYLLGYQGHDVPRYRPPFPFHHGRVGRVRGRVSETEQASR
eukprot:scaffold8195_cov156-Amphora_coffeaeformis.AAC.5